MELSAEELALGYRGVPVVRDVSFSVKGGDVLAVAGHNGCGKSTLVKTLLGTLPLLSGSIQWNPGRPDTIAYLGQRTEFDTRFPVRVRDLAEMGIWGRLGFGGQVDAASRQRIAQAMERTRVDHIADMPLHTLSAGQLQRALFARTIVQDASIILLDEPFTAVDQSTEAELLSLIDDWSAEGRATILVLHDLTAVLQHCTSALLLGHGQSQFGPPTETLTPSNLVKFGYLSASQAAWQETMYKKAAQEITDPANV